LRSLEQLDAVARSPPDDCRPARLAARHGRCRTHATADSTWNSTTGAEQACWIESGPRGLTVLGQVLFPEAGSFRCRPEASWLGHGLMVQPPRCAAGTGESVTARGPDCWDTPPSGRGRWCALPRRGVRLAVRVVASGARPCSRKCHDGSREPSATLQRAMAPEGPRWITFCRNGYHAVQQEGSP
jgi:hypothetical protein